MKKHETFEYFKNKLDKQKEKDLDRWDENEEDMLNCVEQDYQSKLRYFELLFVEQKPEAANRLLSRLDTSVRDNVVDILTIY